MNAKVFSRGDDGTPATGRQEQIRTQAAAEEEAAHGDNTHGLVVV
jgi:hypothetical protein